MRALYKILNTVSGRNFFSLFKSPIDLETLVDTLFEYGSSNSDVRLW